MISDSPILNLQEVGFLDERCHTGKLQIKTKSVFLYCEKPACSFSVLTPVPERKLDICILASYKDVIQRDVLLHNASLFKGLSESSRHHDINNSPLSDVTN